jgi:hypothetical protein
VEVKPTRDAIDVDAAHKLFGRIPNRDYSFDISLDGQRILAAVRPERRGADPITLVQNWFAALKK